MSRYSIVTNGRRVTLLQGDITREDTDAIVNAGNSMLLGGGGVDGAIHRAAGPKLLEECKEIKATILKDKQGLLPTGEAVISCGYDLPAKYVIHTVGPIYRNEDNPGKLLRNAYFHSLQLAEDNGLHSLAFPSVGTGVYGCPVEWAADIALSTIVDFLQTSTVIEEVRMVLFSTNDYEVYKRRFIHLMGQRDTVGE